MEKKSEINVWERWPKVFIGMAALFEGLALYLYLADLSPERGKVVWAIGLSLAFLSWYCALMLKAVRRYDSAVVPRLVWIIFGMGIWFGLIAISPVFLMLAGVMYPAVFFTLSFRWGAVGAILLTLILVGGNAVWAGPEIEPGILLIMALALIPALMLAFFINTIINQSSERRDLIDQLEATRDDLAAAEREAGVLEERQRLAREIHDTLAQGFTSIVMHLEAAEGALEGAALPASAQGHLTQARQTARDSLTEARRMVWALRPDLLEQAGSLDEAIQRLAARWSAGEAITVSATTTGVLAPLPPGHEVTLLRVAQEALNNVRKHAGARTAAITLSYMGDAVALDVYDDGDGFDLDQRQPGRAGGFGLLGMQERIKALGGMLTVESAPGEGTTIAVSLPLEGEEG
jgi:signal transduction histidine kinase